MGELYSRIPWYSLDEVKGNNRDSIWLKKTKSSRSGYSTVSELNVQRSSHDWKTNSCQSLGTVWEKEKIATWPNFGKTTQLQYTSRSKDLWGSNPWVRPNFKSIKLTQESLVKKDHKIPKFQISKNGTYQCGIMVRAARKPRGIVWRCGPTGRSRKTSTFR